MRLSIIFTLLGIGCMGHLQAQKLDSPTVQPPTPGRWFVEANLLDGFAFQSVKSANTAANYTNAVSANLGSVKFKNGYSYGAGAQLGVFFGPKKHFGLGTGIQYMMQYGEATLSDYRVDYQSLDGSGNIFRQQIVGNRIQENITSTIINLPVVLKYQTKFSKKWGFGADAGALVNLKMSNAYTTSASFDQGAIYKFVTASDGVVTSIYDNSQSPENTTWNITKENFLRNNPTGSWQDYALIKRSMGINVGDHLDAHSTSGVKEYNTGSIGLIVQPSITYQLSNNLLVYLGGYLIVQQFKNNNQLDYKLTDGNGSYNSFLNNVTTNNTVASGVTIGARFAFGKARQLDQDKDGIVDSKDKCPTVFGLAKFEGCPDTDGDDVPDYADSCYAIFGKVQFHGCPDVDNDSTPDQLDDCPLVAGPVRFNGCPDRDNDGIVDKNDHCPDLFGTATFFGCPDTDGDGVADDVDACPLVWGKISDKGCPPVQNVEPIVPQSLIDMTDPIMYEVNKSVIYLESLPIIESALNELNKDKDATITIDGHADSSGPESVNILLSKSRANAVKKQLTDRGVNPARLKVVGHGSKLPTATNSTYEGKAQNRRAKMKLYRTK